MSAVIGRSSALQRRIDEWNTLRSAEVVRIKKRYPNETIDQMMARLRAWEAEHDFVRHVRL